MSVIANRNDKDGIKRVHVSVPILDSLWAGVKVPRPPEDGNNEESSDDDVDGAGEINKKKGEHVGDAMNISIAKKSAQKPATLQRNPSTTARPG
ncbi:hypothetical protein BIW11_02231 [Tropilaelaps mercedesae]|uniref:Uncharacterized protein n=1 Tax=Tropilaelaps mercedesae TaxID=418985 RepID=A0A1V9X1I6_9ACAR|nr:hypothetical protein BIW11_02231 [Tropilaelaps mercedesae]